MTSDRPVLGFLGIGLMGEKMTLRLLSQGYAVHVWNFVAGKTAAVEAAGARVHADAASVTRAAEIVLMCVLDTDAVENSVFGKGGVVEGAAAGKVLVDHSTIVPDRSRAMAERLRRETGMGWVDAPVSGGPPAAVAGQLSIMAGGEPTDIERVRPVMGVLGQRFTAMGPPGAGQTTKFVNQILVCTHFAVLAEALAFAQAAGIDAARLPEALGGGYADSPMLQRFLPRMVARDFAPAGYARQVLKDLDMVQATAKDMKVPLPMTSQAATLYRMLVARGGGELDAIAIAKLFDRTPL
ncbi:MAG: NAD(P)-dependent oxidoreductase [Alphaproteobacteria bacterium]|nr:NAD(P)-dependent oxidoreductase [Alphaproteobacteria bacterium]